MQFIKLLEILSGPFHPLDLSAEFEALKFFSVRSKISPKEIEQILKNVSNLRDRINKKLCKKLEKSRLEISSQKKETNSENEKKQNSQNGNR